MNHEPGKPAKSLAIMRMVDDFVAAFEVAYERDGSAKIEQFLPALDHPARADACRELIRVDLEFGWRCGKPTSLECYLERFPELKNDPVGLSGVAYEEFRQRLQAGENPDPNEYRQRLGISTAGWPKIEAFSDESTSTGSTDFLLTGAPHDATPGLIIPPGATLRPQVRLHPRALSEPSNDVPPLLRHRLRLIGIGATIVLAYFAALVIANPAQKAGLFLERWPLIVLNGLFLIVCAGLTMLLWSRRPLGIAALRSLESILFGLLVAEMGLGLYSDLLIDHELRQPLAEGDHALFHYASSWSLPFFALIVGYGTLIPSTGRRCAVVVAIMSVVPLGISVAAGIVEHAMHRPFVLSFLLQMSMWITGAAAIAAYGAHRLESYRRQAVQARKLGQYQLGRLLGAGAMGEVYLAEHLLLRRPCAVKVIHPEALGDPRSLQAFEREAQVTASLTHPNTVQIFDFGTAEDGTFYCAMEYLPGDNLDQLVRKHGPLEPRRVVRLLRQVCGALAEAHRAGLIHRDIKPSNIIVCNRGGIPDVAKLLDFGLVRRHHPNQPDAFAVGGAFVGTPLFTSPEQAQGSEELDARTDIYSLGAVAYFMLVGRPPFERSNVLDILAAHSHSSATPLRKFKPEIPSSLESIVLRCLEKDPKLRYPNVESLDAELKAFEEQFFDSRNPE